MFSKSNRLPAGAAEGNRRIILKSIFCGLALAGISLLSVGNSSLAAVRGADPKTVRAEIGKTAPDFTLPDLNGKKHSLHDYRGKIVVLEWYNPDCPFVKAGHTHGSLKNQGNTVNAAPAKIWLAINSGRKGAPGTGLEYNKKMARQYAITYPILLDESGAVGRAYGAAKTPQMYVIDAKGILRYTGAIDNDYLAKKTKKGLPVINYVKNALAEIAAGEKVTTPRIRPYGCGIHYAPLPKKNRTIPKRTTRISRMTEVIKETVGYDSPHEPHSPPNLRHPIPSATAEPNHPARCLLFVRTDHPQIKRGKSGSTACFRPRRHPHRSGNRLGN